MSVKIYDGYKINLKSDSIFELNSFMTEFRKKVNPLSDELHHKFYGEMMSFHYDRYTVGLVEKKDSAWLYTVDTFLSRKKKIKETGFRDPEIDFGFEIVVIPVEKTLLAIIYTEKEEFVNVWKNQEQVQYFGYWNNVDPDESCSEEEWNERERLWNTAILNDYRSPSEVGMTFQIVNTLLTMPIDIDKCIKYIPSFKKRCFMVAGDLVIKEKLENEEIESNLGAVWNYMFSNEFKEKRKLKAKELKGMLKEYLTKDDLLN